MSYKSYLLYFCFFPFGHAWKRLSSIWPSKIGAANAAHGQSKICSFGQQNLLAKCTTVRFSEALIVGWTKYQSVCTHLLYSPNPWRWLALRAVKTQPPHAEVLAPIHICFLRIQLPKRYMHDNPGGYYTFAVISMAVWWLFRYKVQVHSGFLHGKSLHSGVNSPEGPWAITSSV